MSAKNYQDAPVDFPIAPVAHAQVTGDTTGAVFFVGHPTKRVRITKVQYVNPTGLAADAANFFVLSIRNGATIVADWSTETGQEGAIGAGEYENFTLGADADLVLEAGEKLHYVLDETGTGTLPAGTFFIWAQVLPDPNA
jgi:hypothetical protein